MSTPDPSAPQPPRRPDPQRRWAQRKRARQAWGVVVACLGAFSIFVLIGGLGIVAADALLRDDDELFSSGEERLESRGYAIVSDDLVLDPVADLDEIVELRRLRVVGTTETPVFLGYGPSADVEGYLTGVERSVVEDFDRRGRPVYQHLPGGPPAGPPGEQDFWIDSSEGAGEQRIDLDLADGEPVAIVGMNADGSAPVGVAGEAGFDAGWLQPVGIGLAVGGFVTFVLCGFGVNRLFRGPELRPGEIQAA